MLSQTCLFLLLKFHGLVLNLDHFGMRVERIETASQQPHDRHGAQTPRPYTCCDVREHSDCAWFVAMRSRSEVTKAARRKVVGLLHKANLA